MAVMDSFFPHFRVAVSILSLLITRILYRKDAIDLIYEYEAFQTKQAGTSSFQPY